MKLHEIVREGVEKMKKDKNFFRIGDARIHSEVLIDETQVHNFILHSQLALLEAVYKVIDEKYMLVIGDSEYERGQDSAYEDISATLSEEINLIKKDTN